jgi:1-acyl-sn-glycerol-3-phosphate acyltransferase
VPKPRNAWLHARITTWSLRLMLRGLNKYRVFNVVRINPEAVPKEGAVIVAANHRSMADPVILAGALRRHDMAFVAMSELWKWPIVGLIVWVLGYIPIKRGNKKSAERMMKRSERVLRALGLLGIFPEGKCSKDAKLLPFKRGTTDLAFTTMTPVMTVGIRGTEKVWPLDSLKINRHARVTVAFAAKLLDPKDFLAEYNNDISAAKKAFTQAMWDSIHYLSTTDTEELRSALPA